MVLLLLQLICTLFIYIIIIKLLKIYYISNTFILILFFLHLVEIVMERIVIVQHKVKAIIIFLKRDDI